MEISEDTANELEKIAEDTETELESVQETFKEAYENVESNSAVDDEDMFEELAIRTTRTSILSESRIPSDEVEMLTIGGSIRNWSNGDSFVGKALVDQGDDSPEMIGTVIVSEEDANLGKVQEAFSEVGNIVQAEFSVSESDVPKHLVLNSVDATEVDFQKPDDRGPLVSDIRDAIPTVTIEDITDDLSSVQRDEDTGNLYPTDFGVDIRHIRADIYDGYKNPEEGNGTYTLRDDTVFDEDDIVESDVYDAENANENATPGLTAWADPHVMDYGSGSVCDFFGTITKNDDGIPTMNIDGIFAIMPEEFDGYVDESSDEGQKRETSSSSIDSKKI